MSTRAGPLLLATLGAALALTPGLPVHAESLGEARLSVVRSRHALHCPDESALAARVRSLRPGRSEVTSDLRIDIVIENEDDRGLRARVSVHGVHQGERELRSEGPGCEGLAEALAVSLALLLDENAPPPTPAAPVSSATSVASSAPAASSASPASSASSSTAAASLAPAAPPSTGARPARVELPRGSPWGAWPHPLLGVDVGGGLVVGLPGTIAPALDLGLRLFPRAAIHAGARFTWAPSDRRTFSRDESLLVSETEVRLLRFTLDACARTVVRARARLDLCALVAVGPVHGQGHSYRPDRTSNGLYVGLGPGALGRGPLTDWLWWSARVSGLFALRRERFVVDEGDVTFDQGVLGGELVVGFEAQL